MGVDDSKSRPGEAILIIKRASFQKLQTRRIQKNPGSQMFDYCIPRLRRGK